MASDHSAKTTKELLFSLKLRVDEIFTFNFDAGIGLQKYVEFIELGQKSIQQQIAAEGGIVPAISYLDTTETFLAETDPREHGSVPLHKTTTGELKKRNRNGGENHFILTQLVVCLVYSLWNDKYRPEIAKSLGAEQNSINSDLFGDIRLIRNSIVHHDGIALPEITRCKILKFFGPGDEILLTTKQVNSVWGLINTEIDRLGHDHCGVAMNFGGVQSYD